MSGCLNGGEKYHTLNRLYKFSIYKYVTQTYTSWRVRKVFETALAFYLSSNWPPGPAEKLI